MNISLTPELESFIAGKVDTGRYNSASEVVREALHLLEETDRVRAEQRSAFNRDLALRLASLDRGEQMEPAASKARVAAKSRARRVGA